MLEFYCSPFLSTLRLGEFLALSRPFPHIKCGCCKERESSITLLVYTLSRAGFPSWFGVPLTSLTAQNRLYSLNTSISEQSDLGVPLLIGGLALFHKACHLAFPHMTCCMFSYHYWYPFGVHSRPPFPATL